MVMNNIVGQSPNFQDAHVKPVHGYNLWNRAVRATDEAESTTVSNQKGGSSETPPVVPVRGNEVREPFTMDNSRP